MIPRILSITLALLFTLTILTHVSAADKDDLATQFATLNANVLPADDERTKTLPAMLRGEGQ